MTIDALSSLISDQWARRGALAKSISNWHLIGYNEGYCSYTGYIILPCFYGIRLWIWPEHLVATRVRRALGTRMDLDLLFLISVHFIRRLAPTRLGSREEDGRQHLMPYFPNAGPKLTKICRALTSLIITYTYINISCFNITMQFKIVIKHPDNLRGH
jgi:hypothetical protein